MTTPNHHPFATPGTVLADKYRVERVLGQGGMGIVVAARHMQLQQRVAIKMLLPELAKDTPVVARFLQEARAQVRIQGDHVVRVLDVGTAPEIGPFMVMEMLIGDDLAKVLETRGALGIEESIDYVLQAAEALAQAHALGMVHRDLKPQNMFLTTEPDGSPLVKILDFGISKVQLGSNATFRAGATTGTGLLGSPAYMSPEQIRSPKSVTAQSDIWSLGVILYELFTDRMPFEGNDLVGLLTAISIAQPLDVRAHRPEVPGPVANAVMRCLAKDPAGRPADLAELALSIALDGPSHTRAARIAQIARRLTGAPSAPPPPPRATAFAATQEMAPRAPGAAISNHHEWASTMVGDHGASRAPSRGWLAASVGAALMAAALAFLGARGAGASSAAPAAASAPAAQAALAPRTPSVEPAEVQSVNSATVAPVAPLVASPPHLVRGRAGVRTAPLATGHSKIDRDVRFVQPAPQPAVRAQPTGELWDTRK